MELPGYPSNCQMVEKGVRVSASDRLPECVCVRACVRVIRKTIKVEQKHQPDKVHLRIVSAENRKWTCGRDGSNNQPSRPAT